MIIVCFTVTMRNIKNKGHKHKKNKITNENNPGLIENIHKRQ